MSNPDLTRLATALEYVDLGAALYLAGGSDQAARLLAAAAERLLGDLVRLVDPPHADDDTLARLEQVARGYLSRTVLPRGSARAWAGEAVLGSPDAIRDETGAYLRAAWYMLEALGLGALAPQPLAQAVEQSTVLSGASTMEPFC